MEMLREINIVSIIVRLLLATLVGGVLGLERERKNRPAGFRTYMLVCLGASLVMMTNQYVFQVFEASDPVRLGAQVISGIGFLGAGTIIVTGQNKIKGITTAAGLWAAACCGLAIGIGFYELAIISMIFVFVIIAGLQGLDRRIRKKARYIDIYLEIENKVRLSGFVEYAREHNIELSDIHLQKSSFGDESVMTVMLTASRKENHHGSDLIEELSAAPGIRYIQEI